MFTDTQRPPDGRPPARLLSAYGDRTVSKIRTKYEIRSSRRFDADAVEVMTDEMIRLARPRLRSGKALEREVVTALANRFGDVYEGAPFLLGAKDQVREPTRVKPRSWAVLRDRFLAVAGEDGLVRMHSTQFSGTRKYVAFRVLRSTHAWTFHTQERMHERTPSTVRADEEIARAILGAVGMLEVLDDARNGFDVPYRIALPCGEGLLLGGFQEVPRDTVIVTRIHMDGQEFTRTTFPFESQVKSCLMEDGFARTTSYVGVTYVGPDEMGDTQSALRSAMLGLLAEFRPLSEAIVDLFMGQGIGYSLRNANGKYETAEPFDAMVARLTPSAAMRRLRSLLSNAGMRRAMGNDKGA